jgi:hypothetical protein
MEWEDTISKTNKPINILRVILVKNFAIIILFFAYSLEPTEVSVAEPIISGFFYVQIGFDLIIPKVLEFA